MLFPVPIGSPVLTVLMAYHQVPSEEEDKEKPAFAISSGGLSRYVIMTFGLCNASAIFQRLSERTLAGLQWYTAVLYLDDLIVFSKTFDWHIDNLSKVFARLTEAGLKLKAKKCVSSNTRPCILDI